VKPEKTGRLATDNQVKTYNKEQLTYRNCLQEFVKSQSALVKLYTESVNGAIKEYNDYVTELKKKQDEAAAK
jgi:hypothetical protein